MDGRTVGSTPTAGTSGARLHPSQLVHVEQSDGRVVWNPSVCTLADWIRAARPSGVHCDYVTWIQVHNVERDSPGFGFEAGKFTKEPYEEALNKISAIASRGNVSKYAKKACVDSLLETARQQRFTCGKWMVFLMPGIADAAWADIARATACGELGCSAKILPTLGQPAARSVVCCVYVRDFLVGAEVKRVLVALQALMAGHGVKMSAGFKPDVFTLLGIEGKNNNWRLPPTIYSVEEVLNGAIG